MTNAKIVPVLDKRGGKVVGHVSTSTTSIGAAKVAGTPSAEFALIDGVWSWVGKELH